MKVIGLDLSGPRNTADTYLVVFSEQGNELQFVENVNGADDGQIFHMVSNLGKNEPIVIGMDAPLSYNPGGGDRPSDASLRRLVHEKGGGVGIMPPTMIRMVYLTLRGIVLTRMLETLSPNSNFASWRSTPAQVCSYAGLPPKSVSAFKRDEAARAQLLQWLTAQGLKGISRTEIVPDHYVAACAAALGAWQWSLGQSALALFG